MDTPLSSAFGGGEIISKYTMKKFILGKKIGMTTIYIEDKQTPMTLISAGPIVVSQIRNKEKDGYQAIQVAFSEQKPQRLSKAEKNHLGDLGAFQYLREFRIDGDGEFKRGDKMDLSIFEEGDKVVVSGISKAKGFQGVVKRHGFHGGPKSHGQKHSLRAPGSIGSTGPQRVMKGKKMAGRMGGDRITLKNRKIVYIDKEKNLLGIKGAIPGRRDTILEISAV